MWKPKVHSTKHPAGIDVRCFISTQKFERWLDETASVTYDETDLSETAYGNWAYTLAESKRLVGALADSPLLLIEAVMPMLARKFLKPKQFPEVQARLIKAYCSLYSVSGDESLLKKATELCERLLAGSLWRGFAGDCWGQPARYHATSMTFGANTPLVSTTACCFEALVCLQKITAQTNLTERIESIAAFALRNLNETVIDENSSACSTSPFDYSMVPSDNAARAYILVEAWKRFGSNTLLAAAKRTLSFISSSQRYDGSWWNAMGSDADLVVSHHSMVSTMQNLIKCNRTLVNKNLWKTVARGFEFYMNNLLGSDGIPKRVVDHGAERRRAGLRYSEDIAEALVVMQLMSEYIPQTAENSMLRKQAATASVKFAELLTSTYQHHNGRFNTADRKHFYRIDRPYLRQGQVQCFEALATFASRSAEQRGEHHQTAKLHPESF